LRTHPAPHRSQLVALSVFFLFFFLPGCAILKPDARPSDPLQALRYDITQILSDSIFVPSQASIKVVSLDTKEVLFEHNSKLLRVIFSSCVNSIPGGPGGKQSGASISWGAI